MKSKALVITAVAVGILAVMGVSAFAASKVVQSGSISEDMAQNFAYVDAGVLPEDATVTKSEFDFEHGRFVYDVEFYTRNAQYEYLIDASSGRVMDCEVEMLKTAGETVTAQKLPEPEVVVEGPVEMVAKDNTLIGIEKAKEAAIADAGIDASKVVFSKAKQETDDGRTYYEVEFYIEGEAEYDYEIDAFTGAVKEKSKEKWEAEDAFELKAAQMQTENANPQTTQEQTQTQPQQQTQTQQVQQPAQTQQAQQPAQTQQTQQAAKTQQPAQTQQTQPKQQPTQSQPKSQPTQSQPKAQPQVQATPQPAQSTVTSGDDVYKQEGGKVYEYDDGKWEVENDKKIENGKVYEYDDGKWEADDDDDDDD